ncbi:MAG: hypothetical protein IJ748_03235 [Bacteroidales bacterium]|nr:hypothetical protein [Bacteroidales bacterium]
MKKSIFTFVILCCFVLGVANAQQWGIGARLGLGESTGYSLDVKKYNPNTNMEFIGTYFDNNNLELTFLYQWKTEFLTHFDFYYGYGASVGDYDNELGLNFDGVLGAEYFIPYSAFSLAVDWIPQFRLTPERKFINNISFIFKYRF